MIYDNNPELQLASDFVHFTNRNIFLTGKAGTGKTTFLHKLKKTTPKRMVVVAPTGVAAINAGGVTIHSFFQLSFGPQIAHLIEKNNSIKKEKDDFVKKFNRNKIKLIKSIDLLVIDEISMVRADMLDAVDEVLRRFKNKHKPFGGVQLLMIGDLQQLSPVIKENEWLLLKEHYNSVYFFESKALKQTNPVCIELRNIYRQSDAFFIDILAKVRSNIADNETLDALNTRYIPDFNPDDEEGYIILTTHNATALDINHAKLKKLKSHVSSFKSVTEGEFPPYNFPTEEILELKVGAQVMFVKNDSKREKLFYNGKIGKIKDIDDDIIYVKSSEDDILIPVERETWHNVRYTLNEETKEINESIIGSFTQFPLKLAWAITIHKSQGLTFEKAIIDAGASFAFGQVYVALSRCRSFEGMVLRSHITKQSIKNDNTVKEYTENIIRNEPNEEQLLEAKIKFQEDTVYDLFDFSSIERHFYRLNKLVNENANILEGSVSNKMSELKISLKNEITEIDKKFKIQLSKLFSQKVLPEDDNLIQQRIQKGAAYFNEKLENINNGIFNEMSLETDNKNVNKVIDEDIENLCKEIFIKTQCLKVAQKNFNTINHIRIKSDSDLDYKPFIQSKQSKKLKESYKNIPHSELYGILKLWRQHTADDLGMPVYWVLPQKAMAKLLVELPSTPAGLEKIKGIGKVRVKQFGNEILEIINNYCINNDIEREPDIVIKAKPKVQKEKSHRISLDLFKQGKKIEEIAKERNITINTVESHLARFVATEEISLYDIISNTKADLIKDAIEKSGAKTVSELKSLLGNEVSWNEIRLVMSTL